MEEVSPLLSKSYSTYLKKRKMNFEEYLKKNLTGEQWESLSSVLWESTNMRTRKVKNPASIAHSELLELASMLNVFAYTLYLNWGAGRETITKIELDNLEYIFLQKSPDKEKAFEYSEKKRAAMAA